MVDGRWLIYRCLEKYMNTATASQSNSDLRKNHFFRITLTNTYYNIFKDIITK